MRSTRQLPLARFQLHRLGLHAPRDTAFEVPPSTTRGLGIGLRLWSSCPGLEAHIRELTVFPVRWVFIALIGQRRKLSQGRETNLSGSSTW